MESPITALFINNSIIIPDLNDAKKLFMEFYGKPIGSEKPRPGEVSAPLILDPLEAFYLLEKNKIIIIEFDNNKIININYLLEWARSKMPRFDELYPIYKDLRDRGFVVRSGLRYGSDFTVYRHGPGIDHSPYIVHVYKSTYRLDPVEIVKAGRLSHSVRKTFILSSLSENREPVYLMFKWFKP